MTRLQLDEWRRQGINGQEEALTQKALLQEELVTIRARICDVSLEMERLWSQYEREWRVSYLCFAHTSSTSVISGFHKYRLLSFITLHRLSCALTTFILNNVLELNLGNCNS
ncbi:unnamed protein product [Oncorhynchus mykiss]|uniref:Pleckstrin homology domain-containing protein n=1 Tax=Oncorhynchus mykiss TaxID=8022 RepID=A0A060WLR7_ONCMY|nr:unnamed protein product [Oncorhynchus mykiss]